jgi:hypothetical protein
VLAAVRPPSEVTKLAFLDALDQRAADAKAEPPASKQVGRFGFRDAEAGRDLALISELAAGRPLTWTGSLGRVPGGPGWQLKRDAGGYVCVIEHNAAACDALEAQGRGQ